jgi:hypothetical protein
MLSKVLYTSGSVLVVMGIGALLVLDTPTWLGVWNIVMGAAALLYARSVQEKNEE